MYWRRFVSFRRCLVFINMWACEDWPIQPAIQELLSHCGGMSTGHHFKSLLIILIFLRSSSKQAEWPGSFSSNTPAFHTLTLAPPRHPVLLQCGLMCFQATHSHTGLQCVLLLTCRLPGECIICESCPIRIESVSCWLPVLAHRRTLGKQIWCSAVQQSQDARAGANKQCETLKAESSGRNLKH